MAETFSKFRALVDDADKAGACDPTLSVLRGIKSWEEIKNNPEAISWLRWATNVGLIPRVFEDAYEEARKPLVDAYQAACKPLVDAYEEACKPHWDAYEEACKLHWDAYEEARKPLVDAYQAACKPHWDAYQAACKLELQKTLDAVQEWIENQPSE